MIDHDRLFKELIQTFFEEFILLFFPEAYESIDFSQTKFLSEEVFTDVTAGEKKIVDLLVETKLKGEDSLIIVHVEPQSYQQTMFNERMFIYFSRLYEKYRRRILPIAIFSYDEKKNEEDRFQLELDPARMELIAGFFETYLTLNQEEEKRQVSSRDSTYHTTR